MKESLPPIGDRRRQDKKRIIIADANAMLRSFLDHVLVRQGYEVLLAPDGDRAMHLISSARPDLIILDLMLPGVGGTELLRYIRDTPAFEGLPVVVVSDRAGEQDIVGAFQLGAADYLVKPFIRSELIIRIKRLLVDRAVKGEGQKISPQNVKSEFKLDIRAASSDLTSSSSDLLSYETRKERLEMVGTRLKRFSRSRLAPTEAARRPGVTLRQHTQALMDASIDKCRLAPIEAARRRRVTLRQYTQALMDASIDKR